MIEVETAVSCKIWNELAAHGAGLLREGSPQRSRAECHFARCRSCAERAFLLDPTWALHRPGGLDGLDRPEWMEEPSFGDAEIAGLKCNVLEAGRIREVESSVHTRRRRMQIAVGAAVLALVMIGGFLVRTVGSSGGPAGSALAEIAPDKSVPSRSREPLSASGPGVDLSLPSVGSLAPAAARVYDLGQEDFALVMVVHETLDL